MLIVVIAIVLAPLAWLAIKWLQQADPAVRAASLRWVLWGLVAALALRAGLAAPLPLRIALCVLAVGALGVWLRSRGDGGDGPGDDGRDPPVDPDPDPGHRAPVRPQRLDEDEFDRTRAEWERALKHRAPD